MIGCRVQQKGALCCWSADQSQWQRWLVWVIDVRVYSLEHSRLLVLLAIERVFPAFIYLSIDGFIWTFVGLLEWRFGLPESLKLHNDFSISSNLRWHWCNNDVRIYLGHLFLYLQHWSCTWWSIWWISKKKKRFSELSVHFFIALWISSDFLFNSFSFAYCVNVHSLCTCNKYIRNAQAFFNTCMNSLCAV